MEYIKFNITEEVAALAAGKPTKVDPEVLALLSPRELRAAQHQQQQLQAAKA